MNMYESTYDIWKHKLQLTVQIIDKPYDEELDNQGSTIYNL